MPQLDAGVQTVEANVGNTTASASFIVSAAGAVGVVTTQATEVAFAAEITAGNLVRVWNFDNASKVWSFFDPDFGDVSSYDTATSGDIVWVNVTEATTFQGKTLTAGWNLIVLT